MKILKPKTYIERILGFAFALTFISDFTVLGQALPPANANIAEVAELLKKQNFAEAEKIAKELIKKFPKSEASWTTLASCEQAQGRLSDSRTTCLTGLGHLPKNVVLEAKLRLIEEMLCSQLTLRARETVLTDLSESLRLASQARSIKDTPEIRSFLYEIYTRKGDRTAAAKLIAEHPSLKNELEMPASINPTPIGDFPSR